MDPSSLRRLAAALTFGLVPAFACWAQTAAPAAAAPAADAAASAASAPPPPAISVLPKWMQEKLTEARGDPKIMDRYYKLGQKTAAFCANCHGPAGQSAKPEVPNLAGQNTIYVLSQLAKLADGRRKHFFMEGLMRAMSQDEKLAVAIYYTAQEAKSYPAGNAQLMAEGKVVFDRACKRCHQEDGHGTERNARLAGQQAVYLTNTIERYREGSALRGRNERKLKLTKDLTSREVQALVAYMRSLP